MISYRGQRCDAADVGDYQEHVGLLVADAWNGTYVRQGQWLFGAHVRALEGTQLFQTVGGILNYYVYMSLD